MSLVVGVDAGGTGTTVVVADGETLVRTVRGDAANVRSAGVNAAAETIARAVERALAGSFATTVIVGAAGAGRAEVANALEKELTGRFAGARVRVVDDARIALRAAVPHGDGIVLIAGTGSIAYAEIGGASYRAGGYGYLLGDEGSGFSVGSSAVRVLMRSYDERAPRDAMLDALETRLGARSAQEVLSAVYDSPSAVTTIASLAPIVLEHASAGERSATKIVQAAALELADLLKTIVRRADAGNRELPVSFAGGLLRENSMLTYLLETRVANELPLLQPIKNPPPPEMGALALAREGTSA